MLMKDIKGVRNSLRGPIIVLIIFITGCGGRKVLSPSEYLKWMNSDKNGMVVKKEINGLVYEVRSLSPEWMALNELKQTNPERSVFDNTRSQYGNMSYFKLRIYDVKGSHVHNHLKKDGLNPDAVEAYLNYSAQKDIRLITGEDTIPCALFAFSKTYGASNEFNIEMAFSNNDSIKEQDRRLEWDDNATGNGLLKFLFASKDLKQIPQLRL